MRREVRFSKSAGARVDAILAALDAECEAIERDEREALGARIALRKKEAGDRASQLVHAEARRAAKRDGYKLGGVGTPKQLLGDGKNTTGFEFDDGELEKPKPKMLPRDPIAETVEHLAKRSEVNGKAARSEKEPAQAVTIPGTE